QGLPRLRAPEGQTSRLEAPAAWARLDGSHGNALLPERLADARGLSAAALIQVALGRAVVESGVRRIERPRGVAVSQHHDTPRTAQGLPDRIGGEPGRD